MMQYVSGGIEEGKVQLLEEAFIRQTNIIESLKQQLDSVTQQQALYREEVLQQRREFSEHHQHQQQQLLIEREKECGPSSNETTLYHHRKKLSQYLQQIQKLESELKKTGILAKTWQDKYALLEKQSQAEKSGYLREISLLQAKVKELTAMTMKQKWTEEKMKQQLLDQQEQLHHRRDHEKEIENVRLVRSNSAPSERRNNTHTHNHPQQQRFRRQNTATVPTTSSSFSVGGKGRGFGSSAARFPNTARVKATNSVSNPPGAIMKLRTARLPPSSSSSSFKKSSSFSLMTKTTTKPTVNHPPEVSHHSSLPNDPSPSLFYHGLTNSNWNAARQLASEMMLSEEAEEEVESRSSILLHHQGEGVEGRAEFVPLSSSILPIANTYQQRQKFLVLQKPQLQNKNQEGEEEEVYFHNNKRRRRKGEGGHNPLSTIVRQTQQQYSAEMEKNAPMMSNKTATSVATSKSVTPAFASSSTTSGSRSMGILLNHPSHLENGGNSATDYFQQFEPSQFDRISLASEGELVASSSSTDANKYFAWIDAMGTWVHLVPISLTKTKQHNGGSSLLPNSEQTAASILGRMQRISTLLVSNCDSIAPLLGHTFLFPHARVMSLVFYLAPSSDSCVETLRHYCQRRLANGAYFRLSEIVTLLKLILAPLHEIHQHRSRSILLGNTNIAASGAISNPEVTTDVDVDENDDEQKRRIYHGNLSPDHVILVQYEASSSSNNTAVSPHEINNNNNNEQKTTPPHTAGNGESREMKVILSAACLSPSLLSFQRKPPEALLLSATAQDEEEKEREEVSGEGFDIWCFGILAWEMFHYCQVNHLFGKDVGRSEAQLFKFLQQKKLEHEEREVFDGMASSCVLLRPPSCPESFYERIIAPCLSIDPSHRPSLCALGNALEKEFRQCFYD